MREQSRTRERREGSSVTALESREAALSVRDSIPSAEEGGSCGAAADGSMDADGINELCLLWELECSMHRRAFSLPFPGADFHVAL